MPVRFGQFPNTQIDVTLLEPDRVLSVLVQLVAAQIECPRPKSNHWQAWSEGDDDLESEVRLLVRDGAKWGLPDHSQPVFDDLDLAITSKLEQNRAFFNLPKRLDKVLQQLSNPVEVTLDAEFAYPSTCSALLDAFKVLSHPRLIFALNGNSADFVQAAGVGYRSQDRARHNAARLGF